jgi:hypothetical protein
MLLVRDTQMRKFGAQLYIGIRILRIIMRDMRG